MRFIKSIELDNYLNIKHAKLDNLKDLNIIIGPNNCGKTSILRLVELLSRISFGRYGQIACDICKNCMRFQQIQDLNAPINARDKYLTTTDVKATFGFDKSQFDKILPKLSERQNIFSTFSVDKGTSDHLRDELDKQQLVIKEKSNQLVLEHASIFSWDEVTRRIFGHILFCPDERLQTYKGNQIPQYIASKNFTMAEYNRLIEFLKQVVDAKIDTIRHNLELVRDIGNELFNTPIAEQGSGVKSLICLVADILSERQATILLVDEPELGLNPSSKHAFLKFLLEQTKDRQIFLATHDPTFVNPVLWNRENVSVYLYSIIDENFVKVDIAQSKDDPNTFAGYLPHTTSLKQMHIYVEGTTDVYIFQMFLDKYVKERFKEDWYRVLSKIGIYHLAGDFWSHLLYTIPKSPYTSIVVLDGDKRPVVKQVVENYSRIDKDRFRIVENPLTIDKDLLRISSLADVLPDRVKLDNPCPVYCLKQSEIEDYLKPRPTSKEEGPNVAYKMDHVPEEIEQLFDAIFQITNHHDNRKRLSENASLHG